MKLIIFFIIILYSYINCDCDTTFILKHPSTLNCDYTASGYFYSLNDTNHNQVLITPVSQTWNCQLGLYLNNPPYAQGWVLMNGTYLLYYENNVPAACVYMKYNYSTLLNEFINGTYNMGKFNINYHGTVDLYAGRIEFPTDCGSETYFLMALKNNYIVIYDSILWFVPPLQTPSGEDPQINIFQYIYPGLNSPESYILPSECYNPIDYCKDIFYPTQYTLGCGPVATILNSTFCS